MEHDLRLEAAGFRLRPVTIHDAGFIVALRTQPELGRYLHPISGDVSAQEAWIEAYLRRPGDLYWIVERALSGQAEGTVGLYDIHDASRSAEWGRWVLKPGSMAAPASAWLVYRAAFEELELSRVYCRTVKENEAVVSFHDSCGLARVRELSGAVVLHGTAMDLVEHELTRDRYAEVKGRLGKTAELVARRISR